jgi:hypothetical protein
VVPPATTATLPDRSNKDWRIEEILSRIGLDEVRPHEESKEAAVDFRSLIRARMLDVFEDFLSIQIIT